MQVHECRKNMQKKKHFFKKKNYSRENFNLDDTKETEVSQRLSLVESPKIILPEYFSPEINGLNTLIVLEFYFLFLTLVLELYFISFIVPELFTCVIRHSKFNFL